MLKYFGVFLFTKIILLQNFVASHDVTVISHFNWELISRSIFVQRARQLFSFRENNLIFSVPAVTIIFYLRTVIMSILVLFPSRCASRKEIEGNQPLNYAVYRNQF